jgi:hypothetical protein
MKEERQGIDALRQTVDAVASDLERREKRIPVRKPIRRGMVAGWSLAAAAVLAAVALWLAYPRQAPEVEILEMKIQGRPVRAVVVEGRASGTLVVMPGPENLSENDPAGGVSLAVAVGGR